MTDVKIKRKQILDFISSFGKGVEDLKIKFKDDKMTTTVAYISHYLKKTIDVDGEIGKEGDIDITDLPKVKQFLKAIKTDDVALKQSGISKPLHIVAGKSKISLPTSSTIISYSKAPLFQKLIDKAIDNKWTKFHESELPVTGEINLEDLTIVSKMRGILNNTAIFTVTAHVGESEFGISAGKKHEAKLFTFSHLSNASYDGVSLGTNKKVTSTFGSWLMDSIGLFGGGIATIHFGDSTMLVLEKGEDILVIIDQRM